MLVGAIEAAQSGEKLRSLEELLDQLTHERSFPARSHPQAQDEDIHSAVIE